jgi:hypothetical protein
MQVADNTQVWAEGPPVAIIEVFFAYPDAR